ncbi:vesicle transport protein SFT2C [Ascaphus truei]|uniref:vesicle transport protein SFT2C n=1 Tax=Ascaphus truei TaxID=8439 RepID=UPI003F5A8163
MADGRQLQEYVAQNKAGSGGAASRECPSSGEQTGWREWLGRALPPSSGLSWSWSPVESDPLLPGMSGTQRLMAAGVCVALAALCFGLAGLYVPLLLLRARKFAMLWSLGSVLGLAAAALLRGPCRMMRELDPWTLMYVAAVGGTLYAALGIRSTGLTVLGASAQVVAAAGLLLGMLPGGPAGRRYITGLCGSMMRKGVSKALPV